MPTVVGVRLRFVPKTLWFDPAGAMPEPGDYVVVESERGTELGEVVEAAHEVAESDLHAPLKPVTRVAGDEDLHYAEELAEQERAAMPVFREAVNRSGLDMKPVDVEFLFSGDKVVFYFSAEDRVDFRDLVKDLASRFKVRIDMRQVGVRDEARMVGGVGHCGQQLCCSRFGGEFQPVSIRMAKEQDLPLNPLKISGLCGRLMCCLRYEYEAYKDFKSRAPKRGAIIETPAGLAKVSELHTPREQITMRLEDGERITLPLSSMTCSKGCGCPCSVNEEEFLEHVNTRATATAVVAHERVLTESEAPAPVKAPSKEPGVPAQAAAEGTSRRKRRRGGRGGSGGGEG
ncbi:MAG: hypothetical protein FDZ75_04450, partial [Actinobacteria bacterium]